MKSARFSRWHTIFLICALALVLAAAESECEAAGDPSLELTTPTETAEVGKDAQSEGSPSPATPNAVTDKPGVVQNLKIESTTHDSITLRWGAPANATEVSVERYEITVDIAFATDEHHFVADTTFTDDGLGRRKTRRYRVRAVSADGVEGAELTISGTTQSGPSVASLLTKTPSTPGARPGPSSPDTPTPAEAESEMTAKTELVPTTHTVQTGEWLAAIAIAYQVDLQDLMDANGLDATSVIHPGQVLAIPGSTAVPVDDQPEEITESVPIDICQDPRYDTYVADASDVLDAVELSNTKAQEVWEYFAADTLRMFDEGAAAIFLVTLAPLNAKMATAISLEPPANADITHQSILDAARLMRQGNDTFFDGVNATDLDRVNEASSIYRQAMDTMRRARANLNDLMRQC